MSYETKRKFNIDQVEYTKDGKPYIHEKGEQSFVNEGEHKDAEKRSIDRASGSVEEARQATKRAQEAVKKSLWSRLRDTFRAKDTGIDISEFSQEKESDVVGKKNITPEESVDEIRKKLQEESQEQNTEGFREEMGGIVTVVEGDKLENIVRRQFENSDRWNQFFAELSSEQQAVAAGNFLRNLSPEQLGTIKKGLTTENLHKLNVGEKLDFSKVMSIDNNFMISILEKGKKFEGDLGKKWDGIAKNEEVGKSSQEKTSQEQGLESLKENQVTIETNVYGEGTNKITEEVFGPAIIEVNSGDTTSQLLQKHYGNHWKEILSRLENLQEKAQNDPDSKQQLADMGFHKGDINQIRPGKDLNLRNLFESDSLERAGDKKVKDMLAKSKELPEIADVKIPKELEDSMAKIAEEAGGEFGRDLEKIKNALIGGSQEALDEAGELLTNIMSGAYELGEDAAKGTEEVLEDVGRIFEKKKIVTYNPEDKSSSQNPRR